MAKVQLITAPDLAPLTPEFIHHSRVTGDSGSVLDLTLLRKWFSEWLRTKANYDRAYIFELGIKERTFGANKFASKFYDLMTGNYDGVQATEATQPYTTINAAPNSRKGLKFVQGQTQTGLMDFTDKVYAAGDSFTLTVAVKVNKRGSAIIKTGAAGWISINSSAVGLTNGTTSLLSGVYSLECGKTHIIEFQYSNGTGLIKINNIPIVTTAASAAITLGYISHDPVFPLDGTLYAFLLANSRTSEYDSKIIHDTLRAMFPEIEGIGIGYQYWATSNFEGTVDGAGNAIAEVQGATTDGNPELCTNGTFDSGTSGWFVAGNDATHVVTFAGGTMRYQSDTTSPQLQVSQSGYTIGKRYRITIVTSSWTSGAIKTDFGGNSDVLSNAIGTTTVWVTAISSTFNITRSTSNVDITIDSISIKEVGWTDSTLVYNYYLNTLSKTAAQSALAAAMWCHYNNDPALGAIYGKLYNWYAVYTLSLNPPRGWRVPSKLDLDQLVAYLGGYSVAGGKMKEVSNTYFISNVGATNECGFTALGGGHRTLAGSFAGTKATSKFWSAESTSPTTAKMIYLANSATSGTVYSGEDKMEGYSLRLLRNAPNTPETLEKTTGYVTNNIAVTPLDITGMAGGTIVDRFRIISETAITGLQAVLYTGAGIAKETLFSGVSLTANVKVEFPVTVLQSLQDTDYTIRVSCTSKTDTGARFMVNPILQNAYKTQL